MPARGRRLAGSLLALLVGGAGLCACSPSAPEQALPSRPTQSGPIPSASPSFPRSGPPSSPLPGQTPCVYPADASRPDWMPSDLRLPEGSYASQLLSQSGGYDRAIFVVPGSLVELARFILTEWPGDGWVMGRGDSENDEIESQFSRPPAVGAFKAQSQFCFPGYSLMLIIYTNDYSTALPGPGTQPRSPIPPSPSG